MASIMPLISAIAAIPSSALRTTLSLSGANRGSDSNLLTSFSTSNTGVGTGVTTSFGQNGQTGLASLGPSGPTGITTYQTSPTGFSFGGGRVGTTLYGQSGQTIGNGGVAVIRRGSELLTNQLSTVLGGAVTLMDMLQSYEQGGQVYLGNIGTTIQGLTNRLADTAYNGANVLLQQLSNQAVSSPGGTDFYYRRGGGMTITSRPDIPFGMVAPPAAQDGFGFGGVNGQTIVDLGDGPDGVDNFARDTGGLSSVAVSAASPFGTYLGNLFVDGTTSSPRNDGLPVSSLDSSLELVQPVLDFSPEALITNATDTLDLLS